MNTETGRGRGILSHMATGRRQTVGFEPKNFGLGVNNKVCHLDRLYFPPGVLEYVTVAQPKVQ